MKLEDLRRPWSDATAEAATPIAREELIAQTCRRVEQIWAVIFRRDMIETAAAMLVMFWFTRIAWDVDAGFLVRLGAGVVVAGAVFIVYRLHAARLGKPPAGLDAPVREFCRTELARVETQIRLLRTVAVWYLGPIMAGLALMSYGRHGPTLGLLIEWAIFALVSWGVYALNRYAVRKQLEPIRDDVAELLEELESTEQF